MFKKYFSFLLFFMICLLSFAQQSIDLSKIQEEYFIQPKDFMLFEDSLQQPFEKILQIHENVFEHKIPQRLHQTHDYWLRFYFSHSDSVFSKKIFEVLTSQTEHISFFIPQKNGNYTQKEMGYLLPFQKRDYIHKNFIVDLGHTIDFSKPYFIKISSSNNVGFYFKIRSQEHFTNYSLQEYFILGGYYFVLLFLMIYNGIIFFYIKQKVYVFYILMILFSAGLSLCDDGLGFALIWSNFPTWSKPLGLYIFPILYLIFYSLYAVAFLREKGKKIHQIIYGITILYIIHFVIKNVFFAKQVEYSLFYFLPFCSIYLLYVYVYWKEKDKVLLFFIVGNTFSFLGIFIEQLRLSNYLNGNIFTVYAFELGIVLEFISLSFSLGYYYVEENKLRLKSQEHELELATENEKVQQEKLHLMQEKETLMSKINEELEEKVSERTQEISQMNQNLQKLVLDLEKMSIYLDKENWELKREIKQEKQEKLMGSSVSFEEVKQLYPTQILCLKLLEKLKWTTEFSCSKCAYHNYSINEENRSRKCSKCGKIETVTANSLFHAQKAPLQKLFYLTHLAFKYEKLDVKALATELELSEISIYKFIQKVKLVKKEKKGAKKWEELIF